MAHCDSKHRGPSGVQAKQKVPSEAGSTIRASVSLFCAASPSFLRKFPLCILYFHPSILLLFFHFVFAHNRALWNLRCEGAFDDGKFFRVAVPPAPGFEALPRVDAHEARAVQRGDPVADGTKHPPHLPVPPFCQDHLKAAPPHDSFQGMHFAGFGSSGEGLFAFRRLRRGGDDDTGSQLAALVRIHRMLRRHQIRLGFSFLSPQARVGELAVIGEQDHARRVLVQPPDGEDSLLVVHRCHDVPFHGLVRCALHPGRLVVDNVNGPTLC
mmetsp:Transcript_29535/g.60382  ORF Transcript_29535/g.60382 Transcript_29535/m.60382 type:complete len:269 (-) Transcript_29535:413-1219(-)